MTRTARPGPRVSLVWRCASLALLAGVALGAAACGDDDPSTPQAFCDQARDLDQQAQFPSDDQLEDLAGASPDEIADEVELLTDALIERGETAFGEPEVDSALEVIETYEVENCDLEGENASANDDEELADLTPDPDHPYCDVEERIDVIFDAAFGPEQSTAIAEAARRVHDEGLLEEGRALVPDDIRQDFETLANAVEEAAEGDLQSITSTDAERAGRRVDHFCG